MDTLKKPSRRKVLLAGAASLAAAAAPSVVRAAVPKKAPGETRVVAIMGDYWHPAVSQELHVRQILSPEKDWKIYFVQRSDFFTPELIADADLLITARYGGADSLGWSGEPVVVSRPSGDAYMTDAQEAAIVENVTKRGMGWLAVHCTLFTGRKAIEDLIGIEPVLHQEIQPVVVRDLNPEHPITRGIQPFFFNLDEQFDAEIKDNSRTTVLFRTLAVHDKRNALGGWCLEQGKGRVVGLLPGHYQWTYRLPEYQEIFWRAAHWALRREIPPYPGAGPLKESAGSVSIPKSHIEIRAKKTGPIRVVALLGGDAAHYGAALEKQVRDIFVGNKDWRITFVRSSKYFTPECIDAADLLIVSRSAAPDLQAWDTRGLADSLSPGGSVWTDANVRAVLRGVRERGMGFLALHNTVASGSRELEDFLDIVPVAAMETQPLWVRDLNREHPVTKGIGPFLIDLDEQFGAVIKSPDTISLFETTAVHDKRHAVGGWCLERGKGRVVGLLPGHSASTWRTTEYREILWRSAHWALGLEIPPFPQRKV